MKFLLDPWLSGIVGYDVIRVCLENDEAIDPKMIFPGPDGRRTAFFYAKLPVTSVAQVGALTHAGFRVVDVNVTFEREPAEIPLGDAILVHDLRPEDENDVLAIASSAFVYSRFHLDPFLSKELANNIKREWITSYIRRQRGERLFVAKKDGRTVGFLALLVTGDSKKTAVIDLIGVAKDMQGSGIGRRLVEYHIKDAYQKYARLVVGTQIANLPSIRLYSKCGYTISNSAYVLHAHINEGRLI